MTEEQNHFASGGHGSIIDMGGKRALRRTLVFRLEKSRHTR